MCATKHTAKDIARLAKVPLCLVNYYTQIGLLGGREKTLEISSPKGLELVDFDEFIQCAAEAQLSDEEIQNLLVLNESADEKALHLACSKMTELIQQQSAISKLQEHLETWIFEYCFKTVKRVPKNS